MTTPDLWYIQRLNILRELPEVVVERLATEATLERWGHAAAIARPRSLDEVQIVFEGVVHLLDEGAQKPRIKLARGDLFGALQEDGFLSMTPRASEPVTIATISRAGFEDVVLDHVSDISRSPRRFARKKDGATLRLPLHVLLYTPPQVRLARALIHLVEREEVHARGVVELDLSFAFKAPQVARVLGLDERAVELPLRHLTQRRIIVPEKNRLLIPDLEPLKRVALGHTLG